MYLLFKMKKHRLKIAYSILLPVLILFAIALHQKKLLGLPLNNNAQKEHYNISLKQINSIFPDAKQFNSFGPFTIVMDSCNTVGFFAHSAYYAPNTKGYNGKVPLIVAIDTSYIVRGVILLPNKETGDFVEILRKRNYAQEWNGLSIYQVSEHRVDAISGATQTAVAIEKGISLTIAGMTRFLAIKSTNTLKQKKNYNYLQLFSQLVFLIAALISFFAPKQFRKYRLILLIASIIILGFWTSLMLTQANFYNILLNGFNWKSQIALMILLILSLSIPLLFGKNIYCQNICPLGAIQEIFYKIPNKKIQIPNKAYTYLVYLKQIYLLVIIGLLLLGWAIDLSQMEPFIAFRINIASTTLLFFFIVVLIMSTMIKKPWCKYLCPTGLCLDLLQNKRLKNEKATI